MKQIHELGIERVANRLAGALLENVPEIYFKQKDSSKARRLAEMALAISGSRLTEHANNIGYLYMAVGNSQEAKLWFEAARQYGGDPEGDQLLAYNCGILSALTGDLEDARRRLEEAKAHAQQMQHSHLLCVYRLFVHDGRPQFEEVAEPKSLLPFVEEALSALDKLGETGPHGETMSV